MKQEEMPCPVIESGETVKDIDTSHLQYPVRQEIDKLLAQWAPIFTDRPDR